MRNVVVKLRVKKSKFYDNKVVNLFNSCSNMNSDAFERITL